MVSQGKATWPQNTTKCYPELHESEPYWITDGNGTCFSNGLFETDMYIDVDNQPYSSSMQALDYYYDRKEMIADDNYGWPGALEYDEYPLEIQCSSCWINKFIYGLTNPWGDVWDDITTQIWANMQANCHLTQAIEPFYNISVFTSGSVVDQVPTFTPDLSLCLQLVNGSQNSTCQQVALENSIPVASLSNLNPAINCQYLEGQTLCAPLSCPIAINFGDAMSMGPFLQAYTNFTQTQFLTWNTFINTALITPGDSVCVGPSGGEYVPSGVASQAAPSVYLTTSTPAYPTPPGSVPNCGLWYEVQSGDYCDLIALNFSLTFSQLVDLNPSLDSTCSNLWVGYDYCVAAVNGTTVTPVIPSPAPSAASTDSGKAATPTGSLSLSSQSSQSLLDTTGNPTTGSAPSSASSVTTPTPMQTGMASGCTQFHQAISGDTCYQIAEAYNITTTQFEDWNPAVGSSCASLWVGYYYCVKQ